MSSTVCPVCGKVCVLVAGHRIRTHGPVGERCPGSGQVGTKAPKPKVVRKAPKEVVVEERFEDQFPDPAPHPVPARALDPEVTVVLDRGAYQAVLEATTAQARRYWTFRGSMDTADAYIRAVRVLRRAVQDGGDTDGTVELPTPTRRIRRTPRSPL